MEQPLIIGLERVPCNLCQSDQTRSFAKRKGMDVVQCRNCGLVYVNPRLNSEQLHLHYNSNQSSRIQYYLDVEAADQRTFGEILDLVDQLLPQRGALLDIGPNIGTCLTVARDRGWEVCGVEINSEAAEYCRTQRALNVISGTFNSYMFPANSFDVILMGDVIEHLPDPLDTMHAVYTILRPGGIVVISTPNIATFAGRMLQIKPQEHLYYFSPQTMTELLQKVGLDVLRIESLDRYHNATAMTHSTTLGGLFQVIGPVFRLGHSILGDVVLKLPIHENLLAIGCKSAQSHTKVA